MRRLYIFTILLIQCVVGCNVPCKRAEKEENENLEIPENVEKIHQAMAKWYSFQKRASLDIEDQLGNIFEPISYQRKPNEILKEQLKNITLLQKSGTVSEKTKNDILTNWYINQEKATNSVRCALCKPTLANSKLTKEAIIKLQKQEIASLKKMETIFLKDSTKINKGKYTGSGRLK